MKTIKVTAEHVHVHTNGQDTYLYTPEQVALLPIPTAPAIAEMFAEQQRLASSVNVKQTAGSYNRASSLLKRVLKKYTPR